MPTPMYTEDYDKDSNKVVDEAEKAYGVRVVDELPATGTNGELVMLSTNHRVYVWMPE